MKKITLSLCILLISCFAFAQNGLENIIVERYYVSNAADSVGSAGALPVGSVTYRIYVDMLPNYKFQAVYGVPGHEFRIATTTAFFNNEDYGGTTPTNSATNVRKNSVLLDSYFSVGGAASGKVGVLKSEDNDGSPGNANNILQNNDPSASGPINIGTTTSLSAQDGMITGTPQSVTFVGLSTADLDVFDGISNTGNLFTTLNGSVASLTGSLGPVAATNRVLIGQFTTKGVLSFKLNIQIGTPTGGIQNFVAENPVGNEIMLPVLTYPLTASVGITANPAGPICSKTNVTFTTTSINGGTSPTYQWKKNGVNVGTNSPTYSNASLTNGNQITCVMTSNLPGVSGSPATSNTITMQVNAVPTSTVTTAGPTTFCSGTNLLTLTANSGTGLTYQWYKGTTALSGATAISYVPTSTGTYKVLVTNVSGCTKYSSTVAVTVIALPAATITASGPLSFCAGDSVTLTANSGTGLTYQWKKGTANISSATLQSYTAKTAGTYRVVVTNASGCTKSSATKKVVVNCKTGDSDISNLEDNAISIYPNPVNGPFTVEFNNESADNGTAQIEIINAIGEAVFSCSEPFTDGTLNKQIDLGDKSAKGLYMIKIVLNGEVHISRLIIE
jgi:hypothetical protein